MKLIYCFLLLIIITIIFFFTTNHLQFYFKLIVMKYPKTLKVFLDVYAILTVTKLIHQGII